MPPSHMCFIAGKTVLLRPLIETDVEGSYPQWFNDAMVCHGNSHHVYPYVHKQAIDFIQSLPSKKDALVLAIINKSNGIHIGNISLQRINFIYRSAELAIIIGEKTDWGKGFGREASYLLISHGFETLNLHRIECGTFKNNIGMQKIALSLGMQLEGTRRQAVFKEGRYYDVLEYGILRDEFETIESKKYNKNDIPG
ncbi:N-acetyltransferase [Spirochaetia bacterium]|nr:N-acetyltransferase [Spirochaetia bacterium]